MAPRICCLFVLKCMIVILFPYRLTCEGTYHRKLSMSGQPATHPYNRSVYMISSFKIVFTIEFAVIGSGDSIDLFVEHRYLIWLQTVGQVSG